jgi:hypothetical protein
MTQVKRIVLDVLKPHHPTVLEFGQALAARCGDARVSITVEAVDARTESVLIEIEGKALDFDVMQAVVRELGGSVHSIDAVEVQGVAD